IAMLTTNTKLSTPGNIGSAGRSQDMTVFTLFQTFSLEGFFIAKLKEIRKPDVAKDGKDLLDEAFQAVTRYANEEEGKADIQNMKKELRAYCEKSSEKQKYKPFVLAANHALDALSGCAKATFILPDDNAWAFARNDPRYTHGYHEVPNDRKPDVINSSVNLIQQAHGIKSTKPPVVEDLFKFAHNTPRNKFEWCDIHSCWEFKNKQPPSNLPTHRLDQPYEAHVRTYLPHETWDMIESPDSQEVGSVSESRDDSSASRTSKRKADPEEQTGSLKTARVSENSRPTSSGASRDGTGSTKAPSAVAQVADYAAEAFNSSLARSFMINFVVKGCDIHIWHFDHESPLQSEDFDKESIAFETSNGTVEFVPDKEDPMIHSHYGLSGRCTQVLKGTFNGKVVVLKLSHPEVSRPPEQVVIGVAKTRCEHIGPDAADALQCLPEVLGSQDFEKFRTSHIRKSLSVPGRTNATRIPRAIVFPFYEPITSRTKDVPTFVADYRKIMLAHAIFWLLGVEHGDISEANLRFCTETSWPKLCDWDLSHFTGESRPAGFSNTGTLIFMASDLLTDRGMEGAVTRVYRHDAESLYWVLIWILARFRGGELLKSPPLEFEVWKQQSWESILARRTGAIQKLEDNTERRKQIFSGIDNSLTVNTWFLRRPFNKASNDIGNITGDIGYLKAQQDLSAEEVRQLQECQRKLQRYASLDFIRDVFDEKFFAKSPEQVKASMLLGKKPAFDKAIKACPAPKSSY
ncbi:hypothetical protein MPER_12606, partial [Moniliophthora perniciosa FA553]